MITQEAVKNKYAVNQIMIKKCHNIDAFQYANELFLDPTKCISASMMLPQLVRENYSRKGSFYRTKKLVVKNHCKKF